MENGGKNGLVTTTNGDRKEQQRGKAERQKRAINISIFQGFPLSSNFCVDYLDFSAAGCHRPAWGSHSVSAVQNIAHSLPLFLPPFLPSSSASPLPVFTYSFPINWMGLWGTATRRATQKMEEIRRRGNETKSKGTGQPWMTSQMDLWMNYATSEYQNTKHEMKRKDWIIWLEL